MWRRSVGEVAIRRRRGASATRAVLIVPVLRAPCHRTHQQRRRCRTVRHLESLQHVGHVLLCRGRRDPECTGDLFVRRALGDQRDNLALSRCQCQRLTRIVRASHRTKALRQSAAGVRRLTVECAEYCAAKCAHRQRCRNVTEGSERNRAARVLVVMSGGDDDCRRRVDELRDRRPVRSVVRGNDGERKAIALTVLWSAAGAPQRDAKSRRSQHSEDRARRVYDEDAARGSQRATAPQLVPHLTASAGLYPF